MQTTPLDLTIAYSEKTEDLELHFETTGDPIDPFDEKPQPDLLGINLVKELCERAETTRQGDTNRVTLHVRKQSKN